MVCFLDIPITVTFCFRRFLAIAFPKGSAVSYIEMKLQKIKEETGLIDENISKNLLDEVADSLCQEYQSNPNFKAFVF